MLILLPASERKTPVTRGKPFDPARLSFPSLAPTRAAVLDALAEVSAGPDAARRLDVPASLIDLVRANVTLGEAPAAPAGTRLRGPALRRAGSGRPRRPGASAGPILDRGHLCVVGRGPAGRPHPAYRLNMCGRLPGLAHLTDVWRGPLNGVLPAAARRGLVVDCRSAEYATAWRPAGELAERTVVVKLRASSHDAKYVRGLLARRIVIDAIDPRQPEELADGLSEHFKVDLLSPGRPGRSWELRVIEALA